MAKIPDECLCSALREVEVANEFLVNELATVRQGLVEANSLVAHLREEVTKVYIELQHLLYKEHQKSK